MNPPGERKTARRKKLKLGEVMNLNVVDQKLQIELTFKEQLLAARFNKVWQIPLAHITQVTTAKPEKHRKELRAPGVFFPGVIKTGTYYTDQGKEFWYVTQDGNYLTIELRDEPYQRIILTLDNNESWQKTLSQLSAAQ
jgi:hypothetical protein